MKSVEKTMWDFECSAIVVAIIISTHTHTIKRQHNREPHKCHAIRNSSSYQRVPHSFAIQPLSLHRISKENMIFVYHKIVIRCRRRNTKANACTQTVDTAISVHFWKISFRERETKSILIAYLPHFNLQLIYAQQRNSEQIRKQRLSYARSTVSLSSFASSPISHP